MPTDSQLVIYFRTEVKGHGVQKVLNFMNMYIRYAFKLKKRPATGLFQCVSAQLRF